MVKYKNKNDRICNFRSGLVRKPHQAPHQLVKRSIAHCVVLVKLLELQTSRKRGISTRTNINLRRGVSSESLLRNRQVPALQPLAKR